MAKSKRLRKKETKRDNIAYIEVRNPNIKAKKLSANELTKERKRIERNERRKRNRAESKAYFVNNGFDNSFINKYRLYDKKVSSYKAADINRLYKMQSLERAGYTYKKTDLKFGWERLADKYPNIIIPDKYNKKSTKEYKGETYIYVGAKAVRAEHFYVFQFPELSVRELKAQIRDRLSEAKNNPDNSSALICEYAVYSGSKEEMERMAQMWYQVGYGKVTLSNKWKEHDFLSMVLACISQMANIDVPGFIIEASHYCNVNNFPFMKGI